MKKLIICFLLGILSSTLYASDSIENSPIGFWKTIDDITGKEKAIVHIWETQNQSLAGRIVKIFPLPNEEQDPLCTVCKGEDHNQRIVGLIFLKDLKKSKENMQWTKGSILDPKTGKVYHSNVTLSDNGQKLQVRGYIGFSIFGRTQTWLRVPIQDIN